ncbi:multiple sugar transport system permease protein [Pullulanibacillus pueri]|uniref:ABC transporter permease n=1 Tax=Pullulanibacillus pueri TaxID=1437324 RepID=A0A8J2ZTB5_9BACL|nr:carbohydrate ABC transporter permease [Pullulanibacillus pueri]MBM7681848.1 multiple sugar transport system permease protein [Pullulanibacillus pueri]GGH76328.1 ABC transporter permease [Pullulanibacillus pueri]
MKRKFPWFSYLVVIIGGISMIVPFLDMVFTSFKNQKELNSLKFSLLPEHYHFDHFITAFQELNMGRLFTNSILATLGVTVLVLLTSTLAGYALTKIRFKGQQTLFKFILATMMFPAFLFLIPNFYITVHFPLVGGNDLFGEGGNGGLATSVLALILPFSVSGFGIFLMRQFVMTIPDAVIEAARIDGASEFRVFWQLVIPMTLPAMATLAIFTFIGQWNELIWGLLIFTVNNNLATLPVGIQMLQSALDPDLTKALVSAAITISVIPVMILFIILQKYYVKGMQMSGVKE